MGNRSSAEGFRKGGVMKKQYKIIRNRAKCKKCGDVIESTYRWNFVTCRCGAVSVDGGWDYLSRCGNSKDRVELSKVQRVKEVKDE